MKKSILKSIISVILIMGIVCSLPLFAAKPAASLNFRVRVVDKDGVAMTNSPIALLEKGKVEDENNSAILADMTDGKGEFRIKGIAPGTYNLRVSRKFKNAETTYATVYEHVAITVNAKNTKDTFVAKIKAKNENTTFYDAKGRTDIHVKNSKGGPVRNMRIEFESVTPPQTNGAVYGHHAYYPMGCTDKDGRLTLVDMANGEYKATFTWLGGKAKSETIKLGDDKVYTYTLTFDETLLNKK